MRISADTVWQTVRFPFLPGGNDESDVQKRDRNVEAFAKAFALPVEALEMAFRLGYARIEDGAFEITYPVSDGE